VIILSGQKLVGVNWETVSPCSHPLRATIFSLPILLFAYYSLILFRNLSRGSTIIVNPKNPIFSFGIISGKYNLTKQQKSNGYISSYNGQFSSAILGLILFSASEILLVLLFKSPEYLFSSL